MSSSKARLADTVRSFTSKARLANKVFSDCRSEDAAFGGADARARGLRDGGGAQGAGDPGAGAHGGGGQRAAGKEPDPAGAGAGEARGGGSRWGEADDAG